MKKIGILSDTHSCWDDRFVTYFKDCDEVWHAGDVGNYGVIERLKGVVPVVRCVCGNVDGGEVRRQFKEMDTFVVEGMKVVMTHIGGYPGKYAPGIKSRIELSRPDIFVCGHSHILKVIYDRALNVLTINPGAAGLQGWQTVRTLLLLSIDAGKVTDCEVVELGDRQRGEIIND